MDAKNIQKGFGPSTAPHAMNTVFPSASTVTASKVNGNQFSKPLSICKQLILPQQPEESFHPGWELYFHKKLPSQSVCTSREAARL